MLPGRSAGDADLTLTVCAHLRAGAISFFLNRPELVLAVLIFLDPEDLARTSCVCRQFRDLVREPRLWYTLNIGSWSSKAQHIFDYILRMAQTRARVLRITCFYDSTMCWDQVIARNPGVRRVEISVLSSVGYGGEHSCSPIHMERIFMPPPPPPLSPRTPALYPNVVFHAAALTVAGVDASLTRQLEALTLGCVTCDELCVDEANVAPFLGLLGDALRGCGARKLLVHPRLHPQSAVAEVGRCAGVAVCGYDFSATFGSLFDMNDYNQRARRLLEHGDAGVDDEGYYSAEEIFGADADF